MLRMKTNAVALVEPKELMREGLKRIFSRSSFRVVWEHKRLEEALVRPPLQCACAAVLTDAEEYASLGEVELLRLRQNFPGAKIVLMCGRDRCREIAQVSKDADGLVLTSYGSAALARALELIVLGTPVLPAAAFPCRSEPTASPCKQKPSVAPRQPQPTVVPGQSMPAPAPLEVPEHLPQGLEKLSEREATVMRLLCDGSSNKLIARRLEVSEASVRVHVKAILRKTGVRNRTEAALLARGLIEPPTVAQM